MTMNRLVFRSGVVPCVVGVFVALFSASALGGEEAPIDEAKYSTFYSLAELVEEGLGEAGTKGRMKVLVPQGTDVAEGFGVVPTYIPLSSHSDFKYEIGGAQRASEYMSILYPEWGGEVSTLGKVEPLVILNSKAPASGDTIAYQVIDLPFSIAEAKNNKLTLALKGTPILMDLDTIDKKLSETVTNCFAYDLWSACYNMTALGDAWIAPLDVVKSDEDESTGSIGVPSPVELLLSL